MNLSPETVNSLPSIVESFDPIKVDATKRFRYVSIPVTLTVFSIVGTGIAIASVKMGLGLAGLLIVREILQQLRRHFTARYQMSRTT